jgi:hypothetical protein
MTLKEYLDDALASFAKDPADTQYQRDYQYALERARRLVDEAPDDSSVLFAFCAGVDSYPNEGGKAAIEEILRVFSVQA